MRRLGFSTALSFLWILSACGAEVPPGQAPDCAPEGEPMGCIEGAACCDGSWQCASGFTGDACAQPGAESPPHGDGDPGVPSEVVFRLVQETGEQSASVITRGESGIVEWVTVLDAMSTPMALDVYCACVCDAAACPGCVQPTVGRETLASPGDAVEYVWDARAWRQRSVNDAGAYCDEAAPLAPGAYIARFCWETDSTSAKAPECADVAFDYPVVGQVVEHRL